jgi:hypothetical protein
MADHFFLTSLNPVLEHRHGSIWYAPAHFTVILKCTTPYLPYKQFHAFLERISLLADQETVRNMIFDKSSLRIFHQPSMEWYHVVWKEQMFEKGLRTYRKVLPEDPLFRESVKIGRERIVRENPPFQIDKYDIQYRASLEKAWADLTSDKNLSDGKA